MGYFLGTNPVERVFSNRNRLPIFPELLGYFLGKRHFWPVKMWKKTVLSSKEKRKSLLSCKYHFYPLNVTSVLLFFHISSLAYFSPLKSQFYHLKSQFYPLKAKMFLAHNFDGYLYFCTSYLPIPQYRNDYEKYQISRATEF